MRWSAKPVRRTSKITVGGVVYIAVTLFLAVGAINSQNNLLFWLFGVSIATLIVSGLFSGSALMKIRLEAQGVPNAFAGETVRLHYLITNQSKFFPLFGALISEISTPGVHDSIEGEFRPAAALHIGPRQQSKVQGSIIPTHRGRYMVRTIRLSTRFPFGLLEKSLIFECDRSVMILPYQLAIKPELVRVVQGQGEEARKRTDASGQSTEYWGLRDYTPGDPKRSIAWKQSARYNKLVVIQHAQPIATRLWVWITAPTSDSIMTERAIALGASLIAQGAKRGVPVGLWAPAMGVRMSPGVGRAHMMRCQRTLGMIDLAHEFGRDLPPPAGSSDDVLVIRSDHSPIAPAASVRALRVDDPTRWLMDPSTLPPALACDQGGDE